MMKQKGGSSPHLVPLFLLGLLAVVRGSLPDEPQRRKFAAVVVVAALVAAGLAGGWLLTREASSGDAGVSSVATTLWLINDRAEYYNGRTYYVYLDYTNSDIEITYYDHSSDSWASSVKIDDAGQQSGHCAPSLCINSSGYIFVFYGDYKSAIDTLYCQVSSNPEDISSWSQETAATGDQFTYPKATVMSDDDIVLFYRTLEGSDTDSKRINRVIRDSGTGSWGDEQVIVEDVNADGDRPYFSLAYDGGRMHLAYHWQDTYHHDLYYMYSDDVDTATSTWYNASGGSVSLPVDDDSQVLVFNSDASWDKGYMFGMDADGDTPHILYGVHDGTNILYGVHDGTNTDKMLHFSYDSGWSQNTVLEDNGVFYTYSTQDSRVDGSVYAADSDDIYATFCVDVSGTIEIQEYVTTDGSSWSKNRDVTSGSGSNNIHVCYPEDFDNGCRWIWHYGTTDYDATHDIYYDEITGVSVTGLTSNRLTWAGSAGETVWSNSSGSGSETLNISISPSTDILQVDIGFGASNNTNVSTANMSIYASTSETGTYYEMGTFPDGGGNVSMNTRDTWDSDPFPISSQDYIYCRLRVDIPPDASASTSGNITDCKVYLYG